MSTISPVALSPDEQALLDIVDAALANIHRSIAIVIATLAEIETKGIYQRLGYTSMMDMCMVRFKMTKDEAHPRIAVGRLVQKHPQLLTRIESGEVTVSNLMLVRNFIKEENVDAIVATVANKSKKDAEEIAADLDPNAKKERGTLKKVRDPSQCPLPKKPEIEATGDKDEFELKLRFGREFYDEIEETIGLMHRLIPSGDLYEVAREAFRALRDEAKKRKFAQTDKPAKNPRKSKDPTYVTAEVKRAVYERDGGQCTATLPGGLRCKVRGNLEFDHIDLRCRGGRGSVENIRLRCQVHNLQGAKQELGAELVAKKIADAKQARAAKSAKTTSEPTGEKVERSKKGGASNATTGPTQAAKSAKSTKRRAVRGSRREKAARKANHSSQNESKSMKPRPRKSEDGG